MRRYTAALMGFAVLLLLSGCASGASEPEETVTLQVLAGQSTSDAGVEDMVDEWLAEHYPQVTLEWECVDWGDKFNSQIRGRIAAGDLPDLIIGKAQDVQVFAGTGNLGEISEECSSRISEDARKAVTVEGRIYGMPYNAWYQGVFYNKGIFRQLDLEIPRTTEELEAVIGTLKDAGIVPFASHFQESWNVANMTMQYMMNSVFTQEPDWGDRFRRGETGFLEDPDMEACFRNNQKILQSSWEDVLQLDQFMSDSRFTQGQAAMYLTGSWSMQFANQYGEHIDFGIFPYPNENGDARLIRETNMTFMKSADTGYGELIDEILCDLIQDEKLAQEILDFTQSSSVAEGMTPAHANKIQEDIDWYEENGQVVDVTTGNAQLIWSFQNALAEEQLLWLREEKTLTEVLEYADQHREDSFYGSGR